MEPVDLRSERLLLDQPRPEDASLIVEELREPEIEHVLTTPWPYERHHAESFIERVVPQGWESEREFTWALRATGIDGPAGFAGMIGLRTERPDLGYWTVRAHRGRGLAAEAVRLVADWWFARDERPLAWECVIGNAGSVGVARAVGFRYTGERPATAAYRDGSHPLSWHGVLDPGPRRRHEGWPA